MIEVQSAPEEMVFSVSDFVALVNQTLDYAYGGVIVRGELANFRVSKNKWVYFDLKDDQAMVRFFGTVYQLPGPLEDGIMLRVSGTPRLHPQYGFSVVVASIRPEGEGSIRRAAELLRAKLAAEGLFDAARKRPLPYPPARIALITSAQSAAFADFMKVLTARWRGVEVVLADVAVQGVSAPEQIVRAINDCNGLAESPEVLVLIRGGGSAEDLSAFNTDHVVRAIAASRVPTLVAIGHEVDVSLAELAADKRASTPSNAAELLVPEASQVAAALGNARRHLQQATGGLLRLRLMQADDSRSRLKRVIEERLAGESENLKAGRRLLEALSPEAVLRRGYALVRRQDDGRLLRRRTDVSDGLDVSLVFVDGAARAKIVKSR